MLGNARKNARFSLFLRQLFGHFRSKCRGNFWPILAIFNLKVTLNFGQYFQNKNGGNARNARNLVFTQFSAVFV